MLLLSLDRGELFKIWVLMLRVAEIDMRRRRSGEMNRSLSPSLTLLTRTVQMICPRPGVPGGEKAAVVDAVTQVMMIPLIAMVDGRVGRELRLRSPLRKKSRSIWPERPRRRFFLLLVICYFVVSNSSVRWNVLLTFFAICLILCRHYVQRKN